MNWYLMVLKQYATFSGRSRRTEYWMFFLINLLITIGIAVLESVMGSGGLLGLVYALAVFIPSLAVAVRRLHDTDRTGWWLLLLFVPLIGALVILVFLLLDSHAGTNRFGSNPKEAVA